eukprot:TRINITY_DN7407_c0_g1_i1.p1 TRINITY_DN7407_c0_g1~~TRINITY_DN7407_c0_g1_i1.p1  ORF type:complete len:352 (+),score=56.95 TRINITY_DN7407_c0_g1_i1:137-1192(+)
MNDFNKLLELNPNDKIAFRGRARIHQQEGNIQAALADLEAALKIDPAYASAFQLRAVIRYENSELDEAINDISKTIELEKTKFCVDYLLRGSIYALKGDMRKCSYDMNQALDCTDAVESDKLCITYLSRISQFIGCENVPSLKQICIRVINENADFKWDFTKLPKEIQHELANWQGVPRVTSEFKSFLCGLYQFNMKKPTIKELLDHLSNETKKCKIRLNTSVEKTLFCDMWTFLMFFKYVKWFPEVPRSAENLSALLQNYTSIITVEGQSKEQANAEIAQLVRIGATYPPFVAYMYFLLHIDSVSAVLDKHIWDVLKEMPRGTTQELDVFYETAEELVKQQFVDTFLNQP